MVASALRRGFKTEAELIALEIRGELSLTAVHRLDPYMLADHLAVPIVSITDLIGVDHQSALHLMSGGRQDFSAMTVLRGTSRLIVVNPVHSRGRRANSVVHELSHLILEHEPHEAISNGGCRRWNQRMEEEADWLAGALLVPRDAALRVARRDVPVATAAAHYGVSQKLMAWRVNHTGARAQAKREQARRRSGSTRSPGR